MPFCVSSGDKIKTGLTITEFHLHFALPTHHNYKCTLQTKKNMSKTILMFQFLSTKPWTFLEFSFLMRISCFSHFIWPRKKRLKIPLKFQFLLKALNSSFIPSSLLSLCIKYFRAYHFQCKEIFFFFATFGLNNYICIYIYICSFIMYMHIFCHNIIYNNYSDCNSHSFH